MQAERRAKAGQDRYGLLVSPASRRAPRKLGDGVSLSGGFHIGGVFDFVFEFYTVDDFRQLVLTAQSPPVFDAAITQFEHHEARGVLRQRALHADGAMSHRREHALDRIRGFRKWSQ